jgi:hypothetical protein
MEEGLISFFHFFVIERKGKRLMANTEGIIFSDIFITNKEIFVNFFSKFY